MNTITKKAISAAAAIVTLVQCGFLNNINASALDSKAPFKGEMLIAVNTNTSTAQSSGNLPKANSSRKNNINSDLNVADQDTKGIMAIDENGEYMLSPESTVPQLPLPKKYSGNAMFRMQYEPNYYTVGQTKELTVLKDSQSSSFKGSYEKVNFMNLYAGKYCTVWVPTDASRNDIISLDDAKTLANEFDVQYPKMKYAFGTPKDIDGDGKVALVCYDIDRESTSSAYIGGYFSGADYFKYSDYDYDNQMDMLHIDSKQGMKSGVSQCYSTVVHELQHMINFSSVYFPNGEYDGEYEQMPSYLNEAFSEAASHLIYGPDKGRINYFNRYTNNFSLTDWNDDLNNYSLSYFFGQYLRTQYGDSSVFQKITSHYQKDPDDYLNYAAQLLGVSTPELIQNFYIALYSKDDQGKYGFKGEDWANDIIPITTDSYSSVTLNPAAAIYVPMSGEFTPQNAGEDVRFVSVGAGSDDEDNKDISKCSVTLSAEKFVYTGKTVKPKVTVKNGNTTLVLNKDYALRYANNINVGTASVIIAGRGDYTGSVKKNFTIAENTSKSLSKCQLSLSKTTFAYTGNGIKPKVTVKDGSNVLKLNTDYVLRYVNNINVGTASVIVAGRGSYNGTVTLNYKITSQKTKDISKLNITLSKEKLSYTGKAVKPKVTVKDGSAVLILNQDYVMRYVNNINKGTASVIISGKGNYSGSVTKIFSIV